MKRTKANAVFYYLRHGCSLTEVSAWLNIRMRALRQIVRCGNWQQHGSRNATPCSEYRNWRAQA